MDASVFNGFAARLRGRATYDGSGTVVLGHAVVDVLAAYGLVVAGAGLALLGQLFAADIAAIARIDGLILMLVGFAGIAFHQRSVIKADGVGIWHESVLGQKRGIIWSEARIEAGRTLEVWGSGGTRILLDAKRLGLPALSALILARVAPEQISSRAHHQLRHYAAVHDRAYLSSLVDASRGVR
jgi:hypothetical protein